MLALDSLADRGASAAARPPGAARAGGVTASRDGLRVLQAEDGESAGAAKTVRPDEPFTGESQYGGGAYVALEEGGTISWRLPDGTRGPLLVSPVVDLVDDREAGTTVWSAPEGGGSGTGEAARIDHGSGGEQGITAAPSALTPVALPGLYAPGERLLARAEETGRRPLRVDALLVRPAVARLSVTGPDIGLALLHNGDRRPHTAEFAPPGQGPFTVELYDSRARPAGVRTVDGTRKAARVTVPAHGFAILRRAAGGRG